MQDVAVAVPGMSQYDASEKLGRAQVALEIYLDGLKRDVLEVLAEVREHLVGTPAAYASGGLGGLESAFEMLESVGLYLESVQATL